MAYLHEGFHIPGGLLETELKFSVGTLEEVLRKLKFSTLTALM
jgi:hypothetical protein